MARFGKIGIGAGRQIDTTQLSPEVLGAMKEGIHQVWADDFAGIKKKIDEGQVTSGDLFGTRLYLQNNYLYRMAAAVLGIGAETGDLDLLDPVHARQHPLRAEAALPLLLLCHPCWLPRQISKRAAKSRTNRSR